MAPMPPALKRTLKTPAPLSGTPALPPIPASYICAFASMLAGVVALLMWGATLIEAVAVIDALVAMLILLAWRRAQ